MLRTTLAALAILAFLTTGIHAAPSGPFLLEPTEAHVGRTFLHGEPTEDGCAFPRFGVLLDAATGAAATATLAVTERCEIVLEGFEREVPMCAPAPTFCLAPGAGQGAPVDAWLLAWDGVSGGAGAADHAALVAGSYVAGEESALAEPPCADDAACLPAAATAEDDAPSAEVRHCGKTRTARSFASTSRTSAEYRGTFKYHCGAAQLVSRTGTCTAQGRYLIDDCAFHGHIWPGSVMQGTIGDFHKKGDKRYHDVEAELRVDDDGVARCAGWFSGNLPTGRTSSSCGS